MVNNLENYSWCPNPNCENSYPSEDLQSGQECYWCGTIIEPLPYEYWKEENGET